MQITRTLLIASLLAVQQAAALAQPVPSHDLSNVFARQAARLARGVSGVEEFRRDLEPLALRGDAVAQFYFGTLTMESDPTAATAALQKSAKSGCAGAAGVLGITLLPSKPQEAKTWLQQATDGGDAGSMAVISGFFKNGALGYERSEVHAAAWAELARRQSYSGGASGSLDAYLASVRSRMSSEELKKLDALRLALFRDHPKVPNYPCGQSLP